MSQKNVAVCWLVTCLSNKAGSCSSSWLFLMWRQALCQPHIQIKGCLWLPVCFSDLLVPPTGLSGQPHENSVSTNMQHAVCKYICIQIESIRILHCAIFSTFNKTVFFIFKTFWSPVLKTAGVLQRIFRSCSWQRSRGSCCRHLSPPATTCPPAAQHRFSLRGEESSCTDRDVRLHLLRDNLLLRVSCEGAELGKGEGRWQMGWSHSEGGGWVAVTSRWGPFLPELPCDPLTRTRTAQDHKPSHPLAWVKCLALWPVSSLGFWPHICIYIITLWPRNLSPSLPGWAQKDNFRLRKLSKFMFSGGFLQLEILICYLLPKLRDRIVLRNLRNHGKKHPGSRSWQPLGYLSSVLLRGTLCFSRHKLSWLPSPDQNNAVVMLLWEVGRVGPRDHSGAPGQPGVRQHCTLPSTAPGKLRCLFPPDPRDPCQVRLKSITRSLVF